MILIHKTFCEVTPESAEIGDFSDSGFVWKNEPMTFKELVDLLENYKNASCFPIDTSIYTWFSNDFQIKWFNDCTLERQESVHYSKDNPSKNVKYWVKAIKYVFNVKG